MIGSSLKFAALAVLVVAVAGALLTRKTFHVEQVIAAPPEDIWSVLMDTATYPDWNPVFVEVTGEFAEGAKMLNKVRDPKGNILEMTAKSERFVRCVSCGKPAASPGLSPLTINGCWSRWRAAPKSPSMKWIAACISGCGIRPGSNRLTLRHCVHCVIMFKMTHDFWIRCTQACIQAAWLYNNDA